MSTSYFCPRTCKARALISASIPVVGHDGLSPLHATLATLSGRLCVAFSRYTAASSRSANGCALTSRLAADLLLVITTVSHRSICSSL